MVNVDLHRILLANYENSARFIYAFKIVRIV